MLYPVQSCFGPVDMWNGRKWRAFHLSTHHVVLAPKYNSTILDLKRESDSNYTIVSSAFEACVGPHSYIIYTCFSLFLSMFWNHVASVDCGPFPFLTVLKREVQDASCSGRNPAGFLKIRTTSICHFEMGKLQMDAMVDSIFFGFRCLDCWCTLWGRLTTKTPLLFKRFLRLNYQAARLSYLQLPLNDYWALESLHWNYKGNNDVPTPWLPEKMFIWLAVEDESLGGPSNMFLGGQWWISCHLCPFPGSYDLAHL